MLHLSSTELSMIRISLCTRINYLKMGLLGDTPSDDYNKEVIARYERLLSALYDFSSVKSSDSQTFLVKVLNTPVRSLGHEDREN